MSLELFIQDGVQSFNTVLADLQNQANEIYSQFEEYAYPQDEVIFSTPVAEEPTDDTALTQTAWGEATIPQSHPQVMASLFNSPIVQASDDKSRT